ncbi:ABC transporter substrate-binding protein [Leucobacter soli]|uniref:ABC transporter substrate-binding protein n=1 Tax=Leucobacter soli TaxID=2812850 RepID=UPI0036210D07
MQSASNLKLHNYESGRFENIVLQTTSPQFKDPEVRRAMRMLVDRQQIVDQVYGGFAKIGNDIAEPSSVYYNSELPQWEHDVDEAMSILKSAGAADMQVEFVATELTPTTINLAQAYTQQLVEAGIDAKMSQIEAGSYYSPESGFASPERALSLDIWGGWSFATFTNLSQLPGAGFNESSWENEQFLSSYQAASNTVDEAERKQHLWDAQEIMHSESGTIIPAFLDVLDVYASNVEGYKTDPLGLGGGDFDYTGIQFTS